MADANEPNRRPQALYAVCAAIVALLSLTIAALWRPLSPSTSNGSVVFDSKNFDAGTVVDLDKVSHNFAFRNTGTRALRFGDIKSSCRCTVASVRNTDVKPGGSGAITVTMKLGSIGPNRQQVLVPIEGVRVPIVLQISADYHPPAAASALPEIVTVAGASPVAIQVTALTAEHERVRIVDAKSESGRLTVQVGKALSTTARGTLGYFETTINLSVAAADERQGEVGGDDSLIIHFSPDVILPITVPVVVRPGPKAFSVVPQEVFFVMGGGPTSDKERLVEITPTANNLSLSILKITNPMSEWLSVAPDRSSGQKILLKMRLKSNAISGMDGRDGLVTLVLREDALGKRTLTIPVAVRWLSAQPRPQ